MLSHLGNVSILHPHSQLTDGSLINTYFPFWFNIQALSLYLKLPNENVAYFMLIYIS